MSDRGAAGRPPSPVTIVLAVIGGVLLLAVGTCVAAGVFLGREAKKVVAQVVEGGIVLDDGGMVIKSRGGGLGLTSSAEGGVAVAGPAVVRRALAGSRQGYVGSWRSARGSTLDIHPDGRLVFDNTERPGSTSRMDGEISAFAGDDIEVFMLVSVTLKVTQAPHEVADHWEMTLDGVRFERR